MPYWRRAKRDANHPAIARALVAVGCSVLELHAVGSGCPDLLVARGGRMWLREVKIPEHETKRRGPSHMATRARQAAFREAWRGPAIEIWTSVDEALAEVLAT